MYDDYYYCTYHNCHILLIISAILAIGVKFDAVYIPLVPNEDAERVVVVHAPQARGRVIGRGCKVEAL